jgi:MFS family permease
MPTPLGTSASVARPARTPLNRQQIVGFWGAWFGWTLDGMDSFIYALVLAPALAELLPNSGYAATPANIGLAGSILFATFLVGWGLSFIWGPLADRFGRTKVLAGTIFTFAIFTGLAATSHTVWELGIYRFLAGVGIGGEWALAGTYVAEAWPEDRRKMGAGYLQTGYYAGFFLAAALNYTIGAAFGWRAMFLVGVVPVIVSIVVLLRVKETDKWKKAESTAVKAVAPLRAIFSAQYRRRTIAATVLLTVAIIGLWAGAVYEPSAGPAFAQGRDGQAGGGEDGIDRDRAVVDRHGARLSRAAADGRAHRAPAHARGVFHRHGGDHCAGVWMGVLFA